MSDYAELAEILEHTCIHKPVECVRCTKMMRSAAAMREVDVLWKKYFIESDESFTECIERTIAGWKNRALKAEEKKHD